MGRWGRQSPVLEPPDPQMQTTPPPPTLPPRTFMRQSSITKIGNMLNTAININGAKKPASKSMQYHIFKFFHMHVNLIYFGV